MKLKYRILRWLGVVSPSGAYPLPPCWAMSKLGRSRYYPDISVIASGDRSVAAGGSIGHVSTGGWAADVAAGPVPRGALTRFSTGEPEHEHGWTSAGLCGPGSGYQVNCFSQQAYVPLSSRQGVQKGNAADAD